MAAALSSMPALTATSAQHGLAGLEVLPLATLRVAGWPIETLHAFAAPALADAARDILEAQSAQSGDLPRQLDDFARLHQHELDRQRRALRDIAGKPRFRRMLAIANPQLARRWADPPQRRDRARWRRVESSIFHTLMRAIGRPTPNGAWAEIGVVGVDAGAPGLCVKATRGTSLATVDLAPFRIALRALSGSPAYRRDAPLRLEATLHSTDTHWRWERERSGFREWESLPRHPVFDLIVAIARSEPPRPAVALLAELEPLVSGDLSEILDRLVLRGLLRSPLVLPDAATDELAALEAVVMELEPNDRRTWMACVRGLRRICGELGTDFDSLAPAAVEQLVAEAQQLVGDLWTTCGLDFPPPSVVRLHRRAALDVTWDTRLLDEVKRAVQDVLLFHGHDGGAELFRRQLMSDIVGVVGIDTRTSVEQVLRAGSLPWSVEGIAANLRDGPETREELLAGALEDPVIADAVAAHCRAWAARTEALHGMVEAPVGPDGSSVDVDPGPWGSMLFRFGASGILWAGPGRPEVAAFRACAERFPDTAAAPDAAIARRDELAALAGVEVVRLLCDDAEAPDSAAGLRLSPHGDGDCGLAGIGLTVGADHRGWLDGPQAQSPLLPIYDGTVSVGFGDRCRRLLLLIARCHGWELLSHTVSPSHAERTRWQHLPRLRLPGGAVLSPRRWTIDANALTRAAALDGPARYLAWRGEIEARDIPAIVHVRTSPEAPELLMRTDSPLAADALLRKCSPDTRWLSVTELPGDPHDWPIVDACGGHHLAEVAVTWLLADRLKPPADA
jgi:hypothetical protein